MYWKQRRRSNYHFEFKSYQPLLFSIDQILTTTINSTLISHICNKKPKKKKKIQGKPDEVDVK